MLEYHLVQWTRVRRVQKYMLEVKVFYLVVHQVHVLHQRAQWYVLLWVFFLAPLHPHANYCPCLLLELLVQRLILSNSMNHVRRLPIIIIWVRVWIWVWVRVWVRVRLSSRLHVPISVLLWDLLFYDLLGHFFQCLKHFEHLLAVNSYTWLIRFIILPGFLIIFISVNHVPSIFILNLLLLLVSLSINSVQPWNA